MFDFDSLEKRMDDKYEEMKKEVLNNIENINHIDFEGKRIDVRKMNNDDKKFIIEIVFRTDSSEFGFDMT